MLPRSRRVSKEYFKTYEGSGKSVSDVYFSLRISPILGISQSKVSVIVSKKVAKSAVLRNTIRRRIYSLFETINLKTGTVCFVYPKKEAIGVKSTELLVSLKTLVSRVTS